MKILILFDDDELFDEGVRKGEIHRRQRSRKLRANVEGLLEFKAEGKAL